MGNAETKNAVIRIIMRPENGFRSSLILPATAEDEVIEIVRAPDGGFGVHTNVKDLVIARGMIAVAVQDMRQGAGKLEWVLQPGLQIETNATDRLAALGMLEFASSFFQKSNSSTLVQAKAAPGG